METMRRKLPIGVQSFSILRQENFLYVDKTRYIYELAQNGRQYFLSRPRRFGKSLFLSVLSAYWEGKKELFEGLDIETLEAGRKDAWQVYPVFCFDFNGENYHCDTALEDVLDKMLRGWEHTYNCTPQGTLSARFQTLLKLANEKTGRRCVVLVDEYDKPLLEALENNELEKHNKAVFKGFFGTLKSYDEYLQFVFITGVTKFSKVSIFSDLNQLRDISLTKDYADLCGITEKELLSNFAPEISAMSKENSISQAECLTLLEKHYDGYRFHPQSEGLYNPFSLLNALAEKEINSYWFATGTPTFLVQRLKYMHFDVRRFTNRTIYANSSSLSDYRADNPDIIPLLYQTGYLTILGYDAKRRRFTLGFPNDEVKYGLLESLLPKYSAAAIPGRGTDILTMDEAVESGDCESIRNILTALFAQIPYTTNDAPFEHYFQSVLYIVFTLLSQFVQCEVHSSKGRADCILETENYVYIFECKLDKPAQEALAQIEEKGYALPYAADSREIFRIGVAFDSDRRCLKEWLVDSGHR